MGSPDILKRVGLPLLIAAGLGSGAVGIAKSGAGYESVTFSSCAVNPEPQSYGLFVGNAHKIWRRDAYIPGYKFAPSKDANMPVEVTAENVPVRPNPIQMVEGNPYYLTGKNPLDSRIYEIVIDKGKPHYPTPNVHISTTCKP